MGSQPGPGVTGASLNLFPAHLWTGPASQPNFEFQTEDVTSWCKVSALHPSLGKLSWMFSDTLVEM